MEPTSARKCILVVDDDHDLCLLMSRRLDSWGYEVLTAESGEVGLQVARAQIPDVILLDVMMPQMRGHEVCAHLKSDPTTRHIPVIFLSAVGLPDYIQAGHDRGAAEYLIKPFVAEELAAKITACLRQHNKGGSGSCRPE